MRAIIGFLLAVLAGAASAQTTTLTYLGNAMAGTSSYAPSKRTSQYIGDETLLVSPTTGLFAVKIVLTGTPATNDLVVQSYEVSVVGAAGNGTAFGFFGIAPNPLNETSGDNASCYSESLGITGCVAISISGGLITGASLNIVIQSAKSANGSFNIGPSGDSISYAVPGDAGGCGHSENFSLSQKGSPCDVSLGNSIAGTWSVKVRK